MSAMMESSETSSAEDDGAEPSLLRKKPETHRKPKSRFKGVFRCGKKFKSQIQTNGVQHYLGLYDTEEDAARAYDSHARAVLGPKAKTNFELELPESEENGKDGFRNGSSVAEKQKGTHPRRTYVGIKARRKRPCEYQPQLLADNIMSHTHYNDGLSSIQAMINNESAMPNNTLFASNKKMRNKLNDHDDNDKDLDSQMPQFASSSVDMMESKSWHDQLYYWFGHLSYDLNNSCLLWKGIWSLSVHGKPELEDFSWNNNIFEYIGPRVDKAIVLYGNYLLPVSGQYSGFYTVDMNEIIGKYFDKAFEIQFDKINDDSDAMNFSVIGNGRNDFGRFVISGTYNAMSRQLEIIRQYLTESDERTSLNIMDLNQDKLVRNPFSETFTTNTNNNLQQHQQLQQQQQQQQGLHDIGMVQMSPSSSSSSHTLVSSSSSHSQGMGSGGVGSNNNNSSHNNSHNLNYSVSVTSLHRNGMTPVNSNNISSNSHSHSHNGNMMMPPTHIIGQHTSTIAEQLNPTVAVVLPQGPGQGQGPEGILDCSNNHIINDVPDILSSMNQIVMNNNNNNLSDRKNSNNSLGMVISNTTTTTMTPPTMSPNSRITST